MLGTTKWITIGCEAEFSCILLCCDLYHPDFGSVCYAISNCAEGDPVARNLVELFRGLYFL